MPTILKQGPYRFYFRSVDGVEPPHIHVRRDNRFAKLWLNPVRFAKRRQFLAKRSVRHPSHNGIAISQDAFIEAWNDYFSS